MSRRATRILVIDDEDIIRDCCLRALSARGYEVHTAANGHEGLSKIAENIYDVIFLDLMMPHMDGLAMASSLQNLPQCTRLVVVSGYSVDEAKHKANDMGADLYIEKPFTPSDLVNAIKAVQGQGTPPCV